ncbi:hypothetical protein SUGI_1186120 [Cryptomeria japonica]|nr:hypothetical protein SUGI_1186120 [Cryptomeria japonica]
MESNLRLVATEENRLMAFRGAVKMERWGRILNEMDDLANRVVREIMCEEFVNNEYRYKVNCDIPTTFVAILLMVGIEKSEPFYSVGEFSKRTFSEI